MHDKDAIKRIEQYMARNNLNQTSMANKLGIATSQLNRWIRTERISNAWVALLREKNIIH